MSVFRQLYEDTVRKNNFEAHLNNKITEFTQYDTYESAIVNRFKWKNTGLEENRPELYLYHRGLCAGYKEGNENRIFPAFPNGKLREDGYYTNYTLITMDGHQTRKEFDEIVLLKNCPSLIPSYQIVRFYCDRLSSILRMIDNAIHRAKAGNVFTVKDEPSLKILEEVNAKIDENKTIIALLDTGFSEKVNRFPIFDNRETDIIAMWAIFEKYKNELLTTFGYNNVGYEKNERLLVDEVTANNDIIMNGFFGSMMDCRKEFCEKYNEKFETDLSCEVNQRLITNKEKMNESDKKEPQPEVEEVN